MSSTFWNMSVCPSPGLFGPDGCLVGLTEVLFIIVSFRPFSHFKVLSVGITFYWMYFMYFGPFSGLWLKASVVNVPLSSTTASVVATGIARTLAVASEGWFWFGALTLYYRVPLLLLGNCLFSVNLVALLRIFLVVILFKWVCRLLLGSDWLLRLLSFSFKEEMTCRSGMWVFEWMDDFEKLEAQ